MAPKYLPYTPRQARVVTGSATTGTASSPVSAAPAHLPQQPGASVATGRLQLQNLKAVAQNHALDTSSLGWALLEELVIGADAAPGWVELWHALSTGKVSKDPTTPLRQWLLDLSFFRVDDRAEFINCFDP